jgi:acid phosphatase (class A)
LLIAAEIKMKRAGRVLFTSALLTVCVAVLPACAAPVFLTSAQVNPAQLLPPPPADGSAATQAELAELHRIENSRTADDLARAKNDASTEDVTAFAAVMGSGFDLKGLPKTTKLFADVREEEKTAAKLAKDYFKRTRPYAADPSLKSCVDKSDAPKTSYPSGHATMGYSMAIVLAALAPEKAQTIMARASEYAENRLVCGVHYRRDIAAGEALGTAVSVELMSVPAFKNEFEAARDELRAAHIVAN